MVRIYNAFHLRSNTLMARNYNAFDLVNFERVSNALDVHYSFYYGAHLQCVPFISIKVNLHFGDLIRELLRCKPFPKTINHDREAKRSGLHKFLNDYLLLINASQRFI